VADGGAANLLLKSGESLVPALYAGLPDLKVRGHFTEGAKRHRIGCRFQGVHASPIEIGGAPMLRPFCGAILCDLNGFRVAMDVEAVDLRARSRVRR